MYNSITMTDSNNYTIAQFDMRDYLLKLFGIEHRWTLLQCILLRFCKILMYSSILFIEVLVSALNLTKRPHLTVFFIFVLFSITCIISYFASRAEQRAHAVITVENARYMLKKLWTLSYNERREITHFSFAMDRASDAVKLTLTNYLLYLDVTVNVYIFAMILALNSLVMVLPITLTCALPAFIFWYGIQKVANIKKIPPSLAVFVDLTLRIFSTKTKNESDKLIHDVDIHANRIQRYRCSIVNFQLRLTNKASLFLVASAYTLLWNVIDFSSIGSFAFYSYIAIDMLTQLDSLSTIVNNHVTIASSSSILVKLYFLKSNLKSKGR